MGIALAGGVLSCVYRGRVTWFETLAVVQEMRLVETP